MNSEISWGVANGRSGEVEHRSIDLVVPWGRGHRAPPRGGAAGRSARRSRRGFGTAERCGGACRSPPAGPRGRRARSSRSALPTIQTSDTSGTRWRTSDDPDDQRPSSDLEVDLVVAVYGFEAWPVAGRHDGGNRHPSKIRPAGGRLSSPRSGIDRRKPRADRSSSFSNETR